MLLESYLLQLKCARYHVCGDLRFIIAQTLYFATVFVSEYGKQSSEACRWGNCLTCTDFFQSEEQFMNSSWGRQTDEEDRPVTITRQKRGCVWIWHTYNDQLSEMIEYCHDLFCVLWDPQPLIFHGDEFFAGPDYMIWPTKEMEIVRKRALINGNYEGKFPDLYIHN